MTANAFNKDSYICDCQALSIGTVMTLQREFDTFGDLLDYDQHDLLTRVPHMDMRKLDDLRIMLRNNGMFLKGETRETFVL